MFACNISRSQASDNVANGLWRMPDCYKNSSWLRTADVRWRHFPHSSPRRGRASALAAPSSAERNALTSPAPASRARPAAWRWIAASAAALALAGCASGDNCDPRVAASPQRAATGCGFRNMDNPQALPSQSSWKIWSRFFTATKVGTVPVDPIPVRPLNRAMLDALDPSANHVIRLGHSSHLLKLHGKYWLIDPVFGERASPFSFMGPRRFHPTPMPLSELPPIGASIRRCKQ